MGCSLSPDQWLAGNFHGGGYVRGMLVDQPKKKILLSTIVDMEPSLIWIFDGHCKQGRCLRRIASSSSSTKKESPKKNTKKNSSDAEFRHLPTKKPWESHQRFTSSQKIGAKLNFSTQKRYLSKHTDVDWCVCLFDSLRRKVDVSMLLTRSNI